VPCSPDIKIFFIFGLSKYRLVSHIFHSKGMKMLIRIFMVALLFTITFSTIESFGQSKNMRDIEKRSPKAERSLKNSESKKVRKAEEKAEDQKAEQKKHYEKAKKEDNERRVGMQTPETKKRMKETRMKADEYNNQGHESFFKRLFKRKKPKT
jgi:hypothetical protein